MAQPIPEDSHISRGAPAISLRTEAVVFVGNVTHDIYVNGRVYLEGRSLCLAESHFVSPDNWYTLCLILEMAARGSQGLVNVKHIGLTEVINALR